MELTISTVRVLQYPSEYDFNHADVKEAAELFRGTMLVTDDGVSNINKDGSVVTAEGGGVLMVVDNSDGKSFPYCPNDYLFVMGVRQPAVADWYLGDASTRVLQVEPSCGWVTDEDVGGFVHTSIAETLEEMAHPIWSGPIAKRLLNWSTYQPFTGKRICTLGLVLHSNSVETKNLKLAAQSLAQWPADETRYFTNLTGRPLTSHTTKRKIDGKTGKEIVTTVAETGLRKSLQGLGVVAFSEVANLFEHLERQIKSDSEAWEKTTLLNFVAAAPHLKPVIEAVGTVAGAIALVNKDPSFAEGEAANVLRAAKRGFNPLTSAKALGQKEEGKVNAYMLADTTVQEQDPTSKEPKAKKTRVTEGDTVKAMIRGHILLNLHSRWADIKKME